MVERYKCFPFLIIAIIFIANISRKSVEANDCDRTFINNPDGLKNGSFSSPNILNEQKHSRQCIYTFIAGENERVQISFSVFNLRGSTPDCVGEYVDLYTELEEPSQDLITTPFGGRYCGRTVPRKRISMYQTLVFGFYTDQKQVDDKVFKGNYEFIDANQFIAGTPAPHKTCSYTIYSDQKREGQFLSPTYPGVYPKNLSCQYRFLGRKGQRVRLEFMDFDLFYGGPHCPFDYLKVYDGSTDQDPLIDTYCGQKRNLMVYSSGENLFVQFTTLKRTADSQNRGFSAWFEFSERFVNLGFIGKNDGEHIKGTECDQKILSRKESNGTVYSPNYPFLYHSNIVCKYYIYGLQDSQHLERVSLEFEKFEIPATDPNECTDAYVRLYTQSHDAVEEFDYVFCGQTLPASVLSEGPTLVIVFSSGSTQGQGFKARYSFETDYKVPGTPSPSGQCHFSYVSESTKNGEINSPRHPSNYPSSTYCIYDFFGQSGQQIKLVFNHFKIHPEKTVAGYNDVCQEDWIEIYEILSSGREIKYGRYCGATAPGPIISDFGVNRMKIILNTDETGVSSGFSASYTFVDYTNRLDCGSNITGKENGIITTPHYPNGYLAHHQICTWYISVRPRFKVLLNFETFSVEGEPSIRGCSGAVVRVWLDLSQQPIELCGFELNNETSELISISNLLKISFLTANKAVGAKGFKASFTEIRDPSSSCDQFRCASSGFCISPSLHCNSIPNCGHTDKSDEINCKKAPEINFVMIGGAVSAATLLVIIIICSFCHRKSKRRRSNGSLSAQFDISRPKPPQFEIPPSLHFLPMDNV